ncbi:metal ABC transporter ATP-binding protein [Secundilactobacillus collinoides]|uniref:ABC-type Mn Zn transport system, ATPase component n=2 Tax=Secundilactobacillus collinoides TaxID=33960 RepID=A0A0R2BBJ9_SECCO|nr:ATP-binding cassette domain-containing protein [Secundilactobacillus collinoides]KRM73947.1 ABC-type Mn Zn transport system, ATPase component [Secundilactobacillus collinoides DSM 20515 = JCM 1123]KZL41706.1 ABC transporter ATPase [Secundilactobacillus collinoides]
MADTILKLNDLSFSFPDKPVFSHLNYNLTTGTFLSIVGENGVGKTTLMRMVLQELKPTSGSVEFLPNRQAVNVGYVPQFRNIDMEYPLSIEDFVSLNQAGFKLPWRSREEKRRVRQILAETGLVDVCKRPLGEASGGEKQKAYLAQALLDEPNLLILDESTASLDPIAKNELLTLVKQINQEQKLTVIFITHDIPLARQYADSYLFLKPNHYESGLITDLTDEKVGKMNNV